MKDIWVGLENNEFYLGLLGGAEGDTFVFLWEWGGLITRAYLDYIDFWVGRLIDFKKLTAEF